MSAKNIDDKYSPEPMSGCWLWTAAVSDAGYGIVWNGFKLEGAHRYLYRTLRGEIPKGYDLDHLCRIRCCVNPWHLEAVTRKVNARRGAWTKLTLTDVVSMRAANAAGQQKKSLAAEYGVSESCVWHAIAGLNWKDAA